MPSPPAATEIDALFEDAARVHTPCSTIHLMADRAYKVRKAVNLGYLDFTTLAARKQACEEELRLNAALAPGVYEAVLPIVRGVGGELALGPAPAGAEVVDYAVQMRRLPDAGMLPAVLAHRPLSVGELAEIASTLAAFHGGAARGPGVVEHGAAQAVAHELRENLAQLRPFVDPEGAPGRRGPGLSKQLCDRLVAWIDAELTARAPLLARRGDPARPSSPIVDGHGDLHAGNICFDPEASSPANPTGLVIYDRLEFRADFRCKDVAAEVACLAFSLDAAGHRVEADRLVELYARRTGDQEMLELQKLYRAHYAAVRAKVHAMRASQGDAPAAEAAHHTQEAERFLQVAAGYTLPAGLVVTCGLPGSGKSVASRALATPLRANIHRADEIRKALAGLTPSERGDASLYTQAMSERTYAEVLARCRADLLAGRSAIADATFRSRALRAPLLALARELGAPAVLVYCHADEAETHRRLLARAATNADASDADFSVFQKMQGAFEAPSAAEAPVAGVRPGRRMGEVVTEVLVGLG